MKTEFTAVVKPVDEGWIGWIEEIPGVNCQEPTYEELMRSLKETLQEALEFNRQEALAAAGQGFREETIAL
jgi:predicted RNase H-like HicB family nuclease